MTTSERLRSLCSIRLSSLTDETTSPERQREVTTGYSNQQGWPVVDTVEDLNVSASKTSPFERPELGPWLREPKLHEWDALIFWRADRAVRSMTDMAVLTQWAQQHRKVIVFVNGPFGGGPLMLDLRHERADPYVSMILAIVAFGAEVEALATKDRVRDTRAFLLPTDRWVGGPPGYPYKIVDHKVEGKTTALDTYAAGVVAELARRTCAKESGKFVESFTEIAHSLNERGELTPRDYFRVARGKPTRSKGRALNPEIERELWSRGTIKEMLSSPRLLGYKMYKSKVVTGPDGAPVKIAEPVLTVAQFQRLQDAIAERAAKPYRTRRTTPLLGVVKCDKCESNASRLTAGEYDYYRCNKDRRHGKRCKNNSARASKIVGVVERAFLSQLGDVRVQVREWVEGEDHTAELAHVRKLRDSLEHDKMASKDWDDEDEARFQRSSRHLRQRIKTLRALPQREAGWQTHLSQRTYGQEWADADEEQRRRLMLNAGMTLRIRNSNEFTLTIPAATMRAGYPGWQPHLDPDTIAYISGDTGATVHIEFTDSESAAA